MQTKLYVPPVRPSLTPRPRLIDQLNAGLDGKLTLISAPAGFGKTTLVTDWLSQFTIHNSQFTIHNYHVAWLSLDKQDNDLTRFLAYFLAALQRPIPEAGGAAMSALNHISGSPADDILTLLINDLVTLTVKTILILDDYHLITAETIHQALNFFLEHMPPTIHLVMTSRHDPPLALPRWRARRQLTEIGVADLRFTQSETIRFLNQQLGVDLTAHDAAVLEQKTEGWITGLQLAALTLQEKGVDQVSRFVQAFSGTNRHIADYLVEEAVSQQTEPMQQFLMQTAVLNQLTGALCDAVTGQENGEATLRQLDRHNLFIIPLDDERRWYRYHHLFAQLLHNRLARVTDVDITRLHERASQWYAQQAAHTQDPSLFDEAIHHALAAQDWEQATNLIRRHAVTTYWQRGETGTLQRWLESVPEAWRQQQPELLIYYAWVLSSTMQLQASEQQLQTAEKIMTPATPSMTAQIAAVRTLNALGKGDLADTITHAQDALSHLPVEDQFLRSIVMQSLGVAQRLSQSTAAASETFKRAIILAQAADNQVVLFSTMQQLADLRLAQGKLKEAIDLYRQVIQLAAAHQLSHLAVVGFAHAGLSTALYRRNELEAAHRHIQQGLAIMKQWPSADVQHDGYAILAAILQAQGQPEAARQAIETGIAQAEAHGVAGRVERFQAAQANLSILQGDVKAARGWLERAELHPDDEVAVNMMFPYLVLARTLMAEGKIDTALTLITRLKETAVAAGAKDEHLNLMVMESLCHYKKRDAEGAMAILMQALRQGEPEGYIRSFILPDMPSLLRRAMTQGANPVYVHKILAAQDGAGDSLQPTIPTLTRRETQVLRLMAAGLSSPDIARELVVGVSTVRSHIKHIYAKLDVHDRDSAIANADTLGLLSRR